jgi:hypothetical protein
MPLSALQVQNARPGCWLSAPRSTEPDRDGPLKAKLARALKNQSPAGQTATLPHFPLAIRL